MRDAYVVAARRTPVAPAGGAYKHIEAWQLAAPVLSACLEDADFDAGKLGAVIMGNALAAGGNPARVAALGAGIPEHVPAFTIDSQCCAGLDAIALASTLVKSGQHDAVLAGGLESYSRRPLRFRRGAGNEQLSVIEQAQFTPWPDRDPDVHVAAAKLSKASGIGSNEQIAWAVASHAAALLAQQTPRHAAELVQVPGTSLDKDSFTRVLRGAVCQRAPLLAGSREFGVNTATTCVAADGAAAVLILSEKMLASSATAVPASRVVTWATAGGDPTLPGLAPIAAFEAVLRQSNKDPTEVDVIELMEAYAVQAIACLRGFGVARGGVNLAGGALARGHPVGASGAILAVRLTHELRRLAPGSTGVAAIAAAGGLGSALMLSR